MDIKNYNVEELLLEEAKEIDGGLGIIDSTRFILFLALFIFDLPVAYMRGRI